MTEVISPGEARFRYEPDPAHPGWMTWALCDRGRFNDALGPMIVRAEGEGLARVRVFPTRDHSNLSDGVHGGAILAFIDVAFFAGAHACGVPAAGAAVTLDCQTQFLRPAAIETPLDAAVELLRETQRLVFMRGLIEQGEARIAAFSGTLRKATVPA